MTTRQRIIREALRLFGERGYAATTIAQIEEAAGLSAGSGALYRHFRSKDKLLHAAVEETLADRGEWAVYFEPDFSVTALMAEVAPDAGLVDTIVLLCQVGLGRLEHDRDVTRILFRDNSVPPAALETFRRDELALALAAISRGLAELAGPDGADHDGADHDWDALAVVVLSAVSQFWVESDAYDGQHPSGIDADRYLRALAETIAARLAPRT